MQEHFYIQRFFSVAIYAIIAIVFYDFLKTKSSNVKRILFAYTLVLTILAYFFEPTQSMDLYRLWLTSDYYNQNRDLFQLIQVAFERWDSPVGLIFVATLSRIDYHLVPAIAAFIFFSNIFYIISDYSRKIKISNLAVAVTVLFFMSRGMYVELLSGIRCMLAFSIVVRLIYDEVFNKKSLTLWRLLIYLTATLLHSASIVAIAIRFLVAILFDQKGIKKILYLFLVIFVSGIYIYFFGSNFISAVSKAEGYLTKETYSFMAEYILQSVYILLCIHVVFFLSKKYKLTISSQRDRVIFTIIVIMSCLFVNVYTIFHRYLSLAGMLAIPIILEVLGNDLKNDSYISSKNLFILSCLLLFFSGMLGNLNGLRFFE